MELTLALAQCAHPLDGDVVNMTADWTRRARERGADFVVLPECLMTPYEKEPAEFATSAQPLDGQFAHDMAAIAAEEGMWMAFTVNERNDTGGLPYNTAVVVDDGGLQRLVYRKVHLFDVGDYRESSKMSAGSAIADPIDTPWGRIGIAICYDLRFPELARKQVLAGCELMLYPAAWVAGTGKVSQWQALLRARAIENGMFVAGLSRCGGIYAGNSLIASPTGEVLARAGDDEELLVSTIDLDEVAATRAAVPSLEHRRPELY